MHFGKGQVRWGPQAVGPNRCVTGDPCSTGGP